MFYIVPTRLFVLTVCIYYQILGSFGHSLWVCLVFSLQGTYYAINNNSIVILTTVRCSACSQ